MFGKNRQSNPPPINNAATINVGAGQYVSSKLAITKLPMMPPRRAATIETATPVALRFVGKISVMRQSNAAFPQDITLLNVADTIKLWVVLYTKYIDAAQIPDVTVLKTETKSLIEVKQPE